MKVIVLIACALIGVAFCRPQYSYNPPAVPIHGGSFVRPSGGSSFVTGGGSSGSFVGLGGGSIGGFGIGGGGSSGGFGIGSGGGGSSGFGIGGGGSGIGIGGGGSGSHFGSVSSGGGGGGFVSGGGGTVVHKHVYVHVAPPEPEEFHQQRPINLGQSSKHYKIIFIKAPSYATPTAQQIALQAQNQEKTLIYVLSKKPDDVADITIPSIAPAPPIKPEVYFIRYKTQSNAGGSVIGGGSIGGSSGGGIISGGGGFIADVGSGISGSGNISGGLISGGISSVGGGLSTSYGPPGHSSPS
ncbi:hypothetical protein FQA39_LY16407 [Lamprigera yunnana]|nr:hypothetical protein FQA39_LY16407 [Lamprigera yunnana]